MSEKRDVTALPLQWVCHGDHADIDGMLMAVPKGSACPNCGEHENETALLLEQVRGEIAKADLGRGDEPWALRGLVAIIDAQAARLLHIERLLTKPNGALTNEWYLRVQSEALQVARGEK